MKLYFLAPADSAPASSSKMPPLAEILIESGHCRQIGKLFALEMLTISNPRVVVSLVMTEDEARGMAGVLNEAFGGITVAQAVPPLTVYKGGK